MGAELGEVKLAEPEQFSYYKARGARNSEHFPTSTLSNAIRSNLLSWRLWLLCKCYISCTGLNHMKGRARLTYSRPFRTSECRCHHSRQDRNNYHTILFNSLTTERDNYYTVFSIYRRLKYDVKSAGARALSTTPLQPVLLVRIPATNNITFVALARITMSNKAAVVEQIGSPVVIKTVEKYAPGPDEILVKNGVISFNPLEVKMQK